MNLIRKRGTGGRESFHPGYGGRDEARVEKVAICIWLMVRFLSRRPSKMVYILGTRKDNTQTKLRKTKKAKEFENDDRYQPRGEHGCAAAANIAHDNQGWLQGKAM